MITVSGTPTELMTVISDLAPHFPAQIFMDLNPGPWYFSRAGVTVEITIEQEDKHAAV